MGHFGDIIIASKIHTQKIWITEPMYERETGRVYMLDYSALNTQSIEDVKHNCYCGTKSLERFGSNIVVNDLDMDGNEDLIVTALSGHKEESGSIHIYFS